MKREIRVQGFHRRALAWPLLIAALLSGCSTLTPQVFPPPAPMSDSCSEYDLQIAEPRFGTQNQLCKDRARAELLRQDYIRYVVDHSTENATMSALLVGIAGAAGYQLLRNGLTGAPTRTLSYLAATGATIYGYSSLTHSPPRQLVYLAGAEALTCVYEASAAIQIPAAELSAIVADSDALRAHIKGINDELGRLWQSELQRSDRCKTTPATKSECISGTTGAGQQLFEAAPPAGCASRAASRSCDRSLENATRDFDAAIAAADKLHEHVMELLNKIGILAPKIRKATDNVSVAVGRAVAETEVSAAAALLAIQNMRSVVAQLSGTAQSGTLRGATERSRHPKIEAMFYKLRNVVKPVEEHQNALVKRLNAFSDGMEACQSVNQLNRITLAPPVDQLELTAGRSYTFSATGTSVAPTVNLFNDPDKAIDFKPPEVNGNLIKATLSLAKSDKNVNANLQFSSPGAAPLEIKLVYTAPPVKVAK